MCLLMQTLFIPLNTAVMRVKTYPTLVFSQTVHASTHMLESLSWTNQIIQELLFGLIDETNKLFRV